MKRRFASLFIVLIAFGLLTARARKPAPGTDVARKIPVLYWAQGIETAEALEQARIEVIAAPPEKTAAWRKAGFQVLPMSERDLTRREKLLAPRIAGRANVASATSRPWIDANGWRFVRKPAGKFQYDLTGATRRNAALAMAEAFAYRADAVMKIDPAELAETGKMMQFLRELPDKILPSVADIGVIDDGSEAMGEVLNLLARRNLLFTLVPAPSPQYRVNIKFGARLGTKEYPASDAANPSDFARKIRRQLGDENRGLRIYGSEVVIGRLTGDGAEARLHLLNYSGNEIEALRVRVRGAYAGAEAVAFGFDRQPLRDLVVADGATEFSVPHLGAYAVVALPGFK
ncbi:MAG: hypothetical protein ACREEM_37180 [Blastocatellia bacterium]